MALQQFNLKLLPETIEQWKNSFSNSEAQTANEFVELLLERFLNPKTQKIEVLPADFQQQIQNLQNEIGQLKTSLSFKDDQISELETRNAELERQISELETRNAELETNPPAPGLTLRENDHIITIPPVIDMVLKKEAEIAAQKSKKVFSGTDILLNCFWETIKDGRYIPFKIWSGGELAQAVKQLKANNQ